jgi:hypothetical protein
MKLPEVFDQHHVACVFSLSQQELLASRVQEKSKMRVPRWEAGSAFALKHAHSTSAEFFDDAVVRDGFADHGNSKSSA